MRALRWILAIPAGYLAGAMSAFVTNYANPSNMKFYPPLITGLAFGAMFMIVSLNVAPSRTRPVRLTFAGFLAAWGLLSALGADSEGLPWVHSLGGVAMIFVAVIYTWVTFSLDDKALNATAPIPRRVPPQASTYRDESDDG